MCHIRESYIRWIFQVFQMVVSYRRMFHVFIHVHSGEFKKYIHYYRTLSRAAQCVACAPGAIMLHGPALSKTYCSQNHGRLEQGRVVYCQLQCETVGAGGDVHCQIKQYRCIASEQRIITTIQGRHGFSTQSNIIVVIRGYFRCKGLM